MFAELRLLDYFNIPRQLVHRFHPLNKRHRLKRGLRCPAQGHKKFDLETSSIGTFLGHEGDWNKATGRMLGDKRQHRWRSAPSEASSDHIPMATTKQSRSMKILAVSSTWMSTEVASHTIHRVSYLLFAFADHQALSGLAVGQ